MAKHRVSVGGVKVSWYEDGRYNETEARSEESAKKLAAIIARDLNRK